MGPCDMDLSIFINSKVGARCMYNNTCLHFPVEFSRPYVMVVNFSVVACVAVLIVWCFSELISSWVVFRVHVLCKLFFFNEIRSFIQVHLVSLEKKITLF